MLIRFLQHKHFANFANLLMFQKFSLSIEKFFFHEFREIENNNDELVQFLVIQNNLICLCRFYIK